MREYRLSLPRGWIATLPPDYLSLAIDASLIVGGHWWGGSKGLARGSGEGPYRAPGPP